MSQEMQLKTAGLTTPTVVITPAAIEAKRVVLAAAQAVTEIKDAKSQADAVNALAAVNQFAKQVEASREAANAPVLKFNKEINAMAKTLTDDLKIEEKRLNLLVGAYADNERRKAAAAAEAARKEEEMVKEQLKRDEAARIGQEAHGRTGTLLQDLDAKRDQAAEQIVTIRQEAAAQSVATPSGVGVRVTWKFQVQDVDALFKARPELCTIEANGAAIRSILKSNNGKPIPGLDIWQETAAVLRSNVATTVQTQVAAYEY